MYRCDPKPDGRPARQASGGLGHVSAASVARPRDRRPRPALVCTPRRWWSGWSRLARARRMGGPVASPLPPTAPLCRRYHRRPLSARPPARPPIAGPTYCCNRRGLAGGAALGSSRPPPPPFPSRSSRSSPPRFPPHHPPAARRRWHARHCLRAGHLYRRGRHPLLPPPPPPPR